LTNGFESRFSAFEVDVLKLDEATLVGQGEIQLANVLPVSRWDSLWIPTI